VSDVLPHYIQRTSTVRHTARLDARGGTRVCRTPVELAKALKCDALENLLSEKENQVRLSRMEAEQKKIANKPKVRRLDA